MNNIAMILYLSNGTDRIEPAQDPFVQLFHYLIKVRKKNALNFPSNLQSFSVIISINHSKERN